VLQRLQAATADLYLNLEERTLLRDRSAADVERFAVGLRNFAGSSLGVNLRGNHMSAHKMNVVVEALSTMSGRLTAIEFDGRYVGADR
jgi:hypothetical protein